MSDIKVINKNKLLLKSKLSKSSIQEIVEANLKEIFCITLLASKYCLEKNPKETMDTLGIDDNNQLVIIEYRSDRFGQVLNKSPFFLDYVQKNHSEFKILANDVLGDAIAKNIVFPARVIVIGEDFNKYDEHAVSALGVDISLIKYYVVKKDTVLFEQMYSSVKLQYAYNAELHNTWFELLEEFIISLGDEVSQIEFEGFVAFRRMRTFVYIYLEDGNIKLMIQDKAGFKPFIIKEPKDIEKAKDRVLKSYEEN